MKKFTVSNMSPTVFNWISYLSGVVFGILGLFLFFTGLTHHNTLINVLGIIVIIIALALPLTVYCLARTTVDYDGSSIRTRSLFNRREILLSDIVSISYDFETCYRSFNNAVNINFVLADRTEIMLTETVPKEDTDRLIKGDRSFVPLLVMYDDIAGKYPDKVKQNKANQTFDYGGLDDDV